MPFDAAVVDLRTRAAACQTPAERRKLLIEVLERELFRDLNHTWNFDVGPYLRDRSDFGTYASPASLGCGTVGCAWGVAQLLWPRQLLREGSFPTIDEERDPKFIGLSRAEFSRGLATGKAYNNKTRWENITPQLVAAFLRTCRG